jgi:hypothetical protein
MDNLPVINRNRPKSAIEWATPLRNNNNIAPQLYDFIMADAGE